MSIDLALSRGRTTVLLVPTPLGVRIPSRQALSGASARALAGLDNNVFSEFPPSLKALDA